MALNELLKFENLAKQLKQRPIDKSYWGKEAKIIKDRENKLKQVQKSLKVGYNKLNRILGV